MAKKKAKVIERKRERDGSFLAWMWQEDIVNHMIAPTCSVQRIGCVNAQRRMAAESDVPAMPGKPVRVRITPIAGKKKGTVKR